MLSAYLGDCAVSGAGAPSAAAELLVSGPAGELPGRARAGRREPAGGGRSDRGPGRGQRQRQVHHAAGDRRAQRMGRGQRALCRLRARCAAGAPARRAGACRWCPRAGGCSHVSSVRRNLELGAGGSRSSPAELVERGAGGCSICFRSSRSVRSSLGGWQPERGGAADAGDRPRPDGAAAPADAG